MKILFRLTLLFYVLFFSSSHLKADWRENVKLLTYSPYYFGPNAFPIPELRSGKMGTRYEVELRGEYHHYSGDKTKDLYGRVFLPFVKGRAGVEVSYVFAEHYKMTPETRDERHAVETKSPISCHGDVIISALFQLLKSEKWLDALISFNIKTASGNRLCDARYTDAASYWIDMNIGRDVIRMGPEQFSLRLQAMAGFYCWMTNDLIHRQNEGPSYGGGFTAAYRNFSLTSDISGFSGYKNNGDNSLSFRNNLRYEFKKNIISFRYSHGMKDCLYDTYSLGYIRCF